MKRELLIGGAWVILGLALVGCRRELSPPAAAPAPTLLLDQRYAGATPTSDLPGCESSAEVRQQACTSQATGLSYWLWLPAVDPISAGGVPLIVYLHGFNHSGEDLSLLLGGGLPWQIEQGRELPALVVSPQCPSGEIWPSPEMVERLSAFVDEMVTLYGADPQRVALTGFSMGGDGAWALGVAHPEQFSALAPVGSWYLDQEEVCAIKDTPVWVFQGELDALAPPHYSQKMFDAVQACGGDIRRTVFPGAGHAESGTLAYGLDDLYEWLLEKPADR